MTHIVRTTKRPWEEIEVGDAEYLDLRRQGLLAPDTKPPATPQATPKTTPSTTGAGTTKES